MSKKAILQGFLFLSYPVAASNALDLTFETLSLEIKGMSGKSLLYTGLLAAMLAAAGCSNTTNTSAGEDVATASLTGKVADGYLVGAKVCLDLNENSACDDAEPSTDSTAGGAFTLEGVTQAQIDTYPLLVEIVVGETVDEDNPDTPIEHAYTLSAPAGSAFISPLTTMIQNEIKEKGLSAEEAIASIKGKLGTTLDPMADYVAGAGGETDTAEYERIYQVAQVVRAVMQQNQVAIAAAAGAADISAEDLLALIMNKVIDALADIQGAIENASGEFDPEAIAGDDAVAGAYVDTSKIEDEIQQREDQQNAVAVNLGTVVEGGGLYYLDFEEHGDDYIYGKVVIPEGLAEMVNSEYLYTEICCDNTYIWQSIEPATSGACYLTADGWACSAEKTITSSGNSLKIVQGTTAATEELINGSEVDLEGRKLTAYVRSEYPDALDPRGTFSEGAKGYRLTHTRTNTLYRVYDENQTGDYCDYPGEVFSMTSGSSEIMIGTPGGENYWLASDGMCNNVFMLSLDSPPAIASSLADLVVETAASEPANIYAVTGFELFGNGESYWRIELVAGATATAGTANFWTNIWDGDTEEYLPAIAYSSTWSIETINQKELLIVNLPVGVVAEGDFDRDLGALFYTVIDDYVRMGTKLKSSVSKDEDWAFNETAMNDLLDAFDLGLLEDLDIEDNYDDTDVGISDFVSALDDIGITPLALSGDLDPTTLKLDDGDGIYTFLAGGTGTYVGLVNDVEDVTLNITWEIIDDVMVINAIPQEDAGTTTYMELRFVVYHANAKQVSIMAFQHEADTAEGLAAATGDIYGALMAIK